MWMFIAQASITVVVSGPPLSPQEAVSVLRASHSVLDRTDVWVPIPSLASVGVISSPPRIEPQPTRPMPIYNPPLRFKLPQKGGR